jgi:peptide/nickel transport system substrate-binding protein
MHGKYVAASGQKQSNIRALTRYNNPAFNSLLDKMEASRPSPQDAEYMKLVKEATRIILTDMPQVTLAEEVQVVVFNSNYWTGYPNAQDPYIAAPLPWEGFNQVVNRLKQRK